MSKEIATTADKALTKLDGFQSVEEMKKWASTIIDSGLLPNSITEPEQVITIVQHGKELGLSPHVAIQNIDVISGKPVLSSRMVGALLKRAGIEWLLEEDYVVVKGSDDKPETLADGTVNRRTTIKVFWKSKVTNEVMTTKFSVTLAQFALAGLIDKQNWKKLPKEIDMIKCK